MYTIRQITTPLADSQKQEILDLVSKNADSVGTYIVEKDSPFYKYVSIREVLRTARFLDRLQKEDSLKMHLIVCKNLIGNIIGYLLYKRNYPFSTG
ncbi:hypothetical protein [Paenibacillus chitinolyticus]